MKVPINWLKEYVDVRMTPEALADLLIMAGVGVEHVDGIGEEKVLELEITANRADLLGMLGVAREVAALTGAALRIPQSSVIESGPDIRGWVSVESRDHRLCPRYIARLLTGIKVGSSPPWMQSRLVSAGLRPVNVIVDSTNYVLLECGQPLHAFDAHRLRGNRVVVRPAKDGEKLVAIDGREYELEASDLVIADSERPVAIAGVMGGKDAEIVAASNSVLIESAQFDPISIRRTSRRLRLSSESSYRFERFVDFETVAWASQRAAQLMVELAGGVLAKGVVEDSGLPPERKVLRLRPERVQRILGFDVPVPRILQHLGALGCDVREAGSILEVSPPTLRRDLREEIDLVEEIARVEGYARVPSNVSLPVRVVSERKEDRAGRVVRETLARSSCFEVLTYSFVDEAQANDFTFWSMETALGLRDPEGRVDRWLRRSLVPRLIDVMNVNEGYRENLVDVFEMARVYFDRDGCKSEKNVLGMASPRGFTGAKGLVTPILDSLKVQGDFKEKDVSGMEPGRSMVLGYRGREIGYVGELSLEMAKKYGIRATMGLAEIDFDVLTDAANLELAYRDFSRFPSVRRDIAVVVGESCSWEAIATCARQAATIPLEHLDVLDVYRGAPVPEGKKSVAFSLAFRHPDRTLLGEEVEGDVARMIEHLKARLGAVLRG